MHKYFAATGCPGPYLSSKFPYIASEVNKRLGAGASSAADKNINTSGNIKIGDIVQFKGGGVYLSASAEKASATKGASRCKVTVMSNGGKHPLHLIREDGKGVYGWVDSANVTK